MPLIASSIGGPKMQKKRRKGQSMATRFFPPSTRIVFFQGCVQHSTPQRITQTLNQY